jgi:glycosyltransferase involved in cell wall biosynthesis
MAEEPGAAPLGLDNDSYREISDPAVMNKHPLVSVQMVTFNHESYIAQAIEGVLMQETDFPIELVIGEDRSTDRTREIVLEYQRKHPDVIRVVLWDKNVGAQRNSRKLYGLLRGKYFAFNEGDDYWTCPHKLQKQVDALERNPDWSICGSRNVAFFEGGGQPSYVWPRFTPKPVSTLDDLSRASFVGISSAVYRRIPIERYPQWVFKVTISDYAHSLFYAQHGKIGFIDEVMSAYRRHKGGLWSQLDSLPHRTVLARDLRVIARHMRWRHRRNLESQAAQALLKIARMYLDNGAVSEARKVLASTFPIVYSLPAFYRRRFAEMVLTGYAPRVIPILRRVRSLIYQPRPGGRS